MKNGYDEYLCWKYKYILLEIIFSPGIDSNMISY